MASQNTQSASTVQYGLTPLQIVTVNNPNYKINKSYIEQIKINTEQYQTYYASTQIGWSLNNIYSGYTNAYAKNKRYSRHKQRGFISWKNSTYKQTYISKIPKTVKNYSRVNNLTYTSSGQFQSYPNGYDPIQYPVIPQVQTNGVTLYSVRTNTISGVQINIGGQYEINVIRNIRDPALINQKISSPSQNLTVTSPYNWPTSPPSNTDSYNYNYKRNIYILIFKKGSTNIEINGYLQNGFFNIKKNPIYIAAKTAGNNTLNKSLFPNSKLLRYAPFPGNYCQAVLYAGDIVVVYSTKKVGELIFTGAITNAQTIKVPAASITDQTNVTNQIIAANLTSVNFTSTQTYNPLSNRSRFSRSASFSPLAVATFSTQYDGIGTIQGLGNRLLNASQNPPTSTNAIQLQYQNYKLFTYLQSGTFTINVPTTVDCLIVGGGGYGWYNNINLPECGGGGGQVIYNTKLELSNPSYPCTYTVTVGNGGYITLNSASNVVQYVNATYSSISNITNNTSIVIANPGNNGSSNIGGTSGNNFSGGTGLYTAIYYNLVNGGGGGGAGAPGINASIDKGVLPGEDVPRDVVYSGLGGEGLSYSISSSIQYYAGGGNGGSHFGWNNNLMTSLGGGGLGRVYNIASYPSYDDPGSFGTPNSGGGGGGGSYSFSTNDLLAAGLSSNTPGVAGIAGLGGSGIVLIRTTTL